MQWGISIFHSNSFTLMSPIKSIIMKRVLFTLLAFMALSAMSFAGTPEKPAPKYVTLVKTETKSEATANKSTSILTIHTSYIKLANGSLKKLPVPQVSVQTGVLGAPGCTGSQMCYGTLVTVSQTNECGQTSIIQQYWVQSSIICYPAP